MQNKLNYAIGGLMLVLVIVMGVLYKQLTKDEVVETTPLSDKLSEVCVPEVVTILKEVPYGVPYEVEVVKEVVDTTKVNELSKRIGNLIFQNEQQQKDYNGLLFRYNELETKYNKTREAHRESRDRELLERSRLERQMRELRLDIKRSVRGRVIHN